jgi:thioredoxin-like negative regulator of GroEL
MEPIVNGLEQEFSGQLQVMRLDADDPVNEQLMQDLGLRGHPSFAVIDAQGNITARFFGPQSAETLREALQNVLE